MSAFHQTEGALRARAMSEGPRLEALSCDRCGSEFFYEVHLNRYAANAYSSVPGGDIQTIGVMTLDVRVCVCGRPVVPGISGGRTGRGASEAKSVVEAIEKVRLNDDRLAESVGVMVAQSVSRAQLEDLIKRVAVLEDMRTTPAPILDLTPEPKKAGKHVAG